MKKVVWSKRSILAPLLLWLFSCLDSKISCVLSFSLRTHNFLPVRRLLSVNNPRKLFATKMTEFQQPKISARLSNQTNSWCATHGLQHFDGVWFWHPSPVSLYPNIFSKKAFEYAQTIQPIWNKLVDKISRDRSFLLQELESVSSADPFTSRLIALYKTIPEETLKNNLQIGIFRSDYMINGSNSQVLQVEINTIAASLGCLSQRVVELHHFLLQRNAKDPEYLSYAKQLIEYQKPKLPVEVGNALSLQSLKENIPPTTSSVQYATTLIKGHQLYLKQHPPTNPSYTPVILFIVQPNERNLGDQRGFEQEIWTQGQIPCEFATLEEIYHASVINEANELIYQDRYLVTVAYYRAGYTPNDYPEEVQWEARTRMEHSHCVKLPSVGYHLVGAKAIQASLCKPMVLERYLNPDEASLLRQCFAEQYALAEYYTPPAQPNPALHAKIEEALSKAKQSGDAWVLKPQREGGGNNFYNQELTALLHEHHEKGSEEENILPGYVLMQRIFPADQLTAFYRKGELMLLPSVSELGIFGLYIGYGENVPEGEEQVLLNEYAGYLLRTKVEGTDEGGVATGFSVINSVSLFDY